MRSTGNSPFLLCSLLVLAQVATANEEPWSMPRTPEGRPDFQGIWTNATQTPLERPPALGEQRSYTSEEALQRQQQALEREERSNAPSDPERPPPTDGNTAAAYNTFWLDRGVNIAYINGEYRTSLIIDPADGRIPMREDAPPNLRAQWLDRPGVEPFDGPELMSIGDRCLVFYDFRTSSSSAGPPMLPLMYNNNYQIIQTADYLVIRVEMMGDARIIPLHGRPAEQATPRWYGNPVAHWEDDTLVVTSTGFHPQQSHFGASEDLVVTERFTRSAEDQIDYRFTMSDPTVYQRSWTAEVPMRARPPGEQLYEYACHEGNYALPGILAGARHQEEAGD